MNLSFEKQLWQKGYQLVIGVDEAGRGALAGPVVAAAVAVLLPQIQNSKCKSQNYNSKFKIENLKAIKDSKQLTLLKREKLYKILVRHPDIFWAEGRVSHKIIDRINIRRATELAMRRAINNLLLKLAEAKKFHSRA